MIKCLIDEISDGYNGYRGYEIVPCHVCGWNIDTTEYYVVTAGRYGSGRRKCDYHLMCYPGYSKVKTYEIHEVKASREYWLDSGGEIPKGNKL